MSNYRSYFSKTHIIQAKSLLLDEPEWASHDCRDDLGEAWKLLISCQELHPDFSWRLLTRETKTTETVTERPWGSDE